MAAAAPLIFKFDDANDAVAAQMFNILSDSLQPDSEVPLKTVAAQIVTLIPETYSMEGESFVQTCSELSEQIPHSHPSMIKLVTIMNECLNASKFKPSESDPYSKLAEVMRDYWDTISPDTQCFPDSPDTYTERYVNFQTFVAYIERDLLKDNILGIWILEQAFQKKWETTREQRDGFVQAASQYLIINGDAIYHQVIELNLKLAAKRYDWLAWHEQLSAVAAVETTEGKLSVYRQETIRLAAQALKVMEEVQQANAAQNAGLVTNLWNSLASWLPFAKI